MLSPGVVLAQDCDFSQKNFSLLMLLEQRKYSQKQAVVVVVVVVSFISAPSK